MKTSRPFKFSNGRGQILSGTIDAPADGNIIRTAVFAPCFTCIKESHGAVKISRALAAAGIAVLRFNMTGLGDSEGDFAATGFSTRVADIVAACRALVADGAAPDILIGHSISGTAALAAVQDVSSVKLLATVGSPADPQSVIEKFRAQKLMDESGGDIVIDVLGIPTHFHKSFLDDMMSYPAAAMTENIACPVLVFHAPNDAIVHYSNAETIVGRLQNGRLIRMSDTATHLFEKGDTDAVFVAQEIVRQSQALI